MKPFTTLVGTVVPLDRANVDTDQIIPKQFLKSIRRSGFGENLFDAWRYLDEGAMGRTPNERQINRDFVLNQPRYQGASDVARARELRLRLEPRARGVGARGVWHSLCDCAELCRHILQQLLQEWRFTYCFR